LRNAQIILLLFLKSYFNELADSEILSETMWQF